MSKKLFKTFNIVLLSMIFLVASCLGNVSFADTADTGANIPEGIYYIQNVINSDYLGDVDYTYMSLNSYTGLDSQKWELIYVSDGYYNIRNVSNGRYLTAPANSSTGSEIEQAALSASKTDRQLWKLTETYDITANDNLQCKIQAKSQEAYSLAMATGYSYDTYYGYDVIQDVFSADTYPGDEWILIPVRSAYLLSIKSDFYERVNALRNVASMMIDDGLLVTHSITYNVLSNTATGTTLRKSDVIDYLESENIIAIRAHAESDIDGTKMYLNQLFDVYLYSWDICNFNSYNCIDMSNCDVALFIGCYTGDHTSNSLPHAAVSAGADAAVGFRNRVDDDTLELWTFYFFDYYLSGETVDDSTEEASWQVSDIGETICRVEKQ